MRMLCKLSTLCMLRFRVFIKIMAEILLNQVINGEIELRFFFQWLTELTCEDPEFVEISTKYKCSRTDFISYFLNFVHEDIGSAINEKRSEFDETKSSSEINRSHSFPLDLSSELDESVANSTPKITKVNSDSSMLINMSPVSPIYKQNSSFTTPKGSKSPLCLGDFIINKRPSTKKKNLDGKKRIKPTNLSYNKNSSFHESENSFNFNKNTNDDLPVERNSLIEEKMKVLLRKDLQITGSPKKVSRPISGEIKPDPDLVTHKNQIDNLVVVYVQLLNNNFVLNLTSEVYYLLTLLLKKEFYSVEYGIDVLIDKVTVSQLFNTVHNIVYFAGHTLLNQIRILRNFDNSTIRLLSENDRLRHFVPTLIENLQKISKPDRIVAIESCQNNICFNLDTDNRQNFPNDPCFHAFRKQRDLFYEILRIWEQQHLVPGFNYVMCFGGKIRTLLNLSDEPTNFVHFARLFKAQLLSACRNGVRGDFVTSLDVDARKLSKLRSRCVTKNTCQGLNSPPLFSEDEDFYKDFILVGANFAFNRHLADAIIEEITELNESNFGSNELEQETDADVDFVTKKQYYTCIKSLRILAKFLGFIESLPYKTDCHNYSENLMTTHLKIRRQIHPTFDVKSLLEKSICRQSIILCVPWLVKYLSMLDHVTLKLPYYVQVHSTLFWIYRNFSGAPDPNIYLVRFCLGWLFELPNVPDNNYLHFCSEVSPTFDENPEEKPKFTLDQLEIIDQDILYFCCPYLDEVKKLLASNSTTHPVKIKHITPVTALQSPDEVARKKLEMQLEEAFFNGQPVSIRKTAEFVSERVASTCVKHVCNTFVPNYKKAAVEEFRNSIGTDPDEDLEPQKLAAKIKDFAMSCLTELRGKCRDEVENIAEEKIKQAAESLIGPDVLPQTKKVCVGIMKKSCTERVKQWIESHVTLAIFTKDFNDEVQKLASEKRPKRPVFMLPPGGNKSKHNDRTTSAAHLLENYRELTVRIIEGHRVSPQAVLALLDDTSKSISERGDFNQCILATICTQLLDLSILLLSHDWRILFQDDFLSKSLDIWRLYYNGCDDLFKSLLCPRNVTILGQSNDRKASWEAFARFCAFLTKNQLLTSEVFESQCTGIFRCDWDQHTLKLIIDFFKTFHGLYEEQGGNASDFTFLLNFFSDYCEDLF